MQILLPKETGKGEPVAKKWFENFLKELTAEFGGATSFVRAPGQGLWRGSGETERDTIAVVEVMAEELAKGYWRKLRERKRTLTGRNRDPRQADNPDLKIFEEERWTR